MMTDKWRFETLVKFLAEIWDEDPINDNEDIVKFEDAVEAYGGGRAFFGVTRGHSDAIDIYTNPTGMSYYDRLGTKFLAQYYDGYQAPFEVCYWKNSIEEFIELFRSTCPKLYMEYLGRYSIIEKH